MGICKGRSAAQSGEEMKRRTRKNSELEELEVKEYDLTWVEPDAYGRIPLWFCGFLFKALSARRMDMVMALTQGVPSYLPILGTE